MNSSIWVLLQGIIVISIHVYDIGITKCSGSDANLHSQGMGKTVYYSYKAAKYEEKKKKYYVYFLVGFDEASI